MDKTGAFGGPAAKRARVIPTTGAAPPLAADGGGTAPDGLVLPPAQKSDPNKLHMVQDVTGAWKQVAGHEGHLKAKFGLLPRPTAPAMQLADAAQKPVPTTTMTAASELDEGRFKANITAWRYLTTPASKERVVVEVEFDVSQGDWSYAPGDSIGIDCCNNPSEVDAFLHCLGEDPSRLVSVVPLDQTPSDKPAPTAVSKGAGPPQHLVKKVPVMLKELVAWNVDLRSQPKKAMLRMLADYASDQAEADDLYLLSCIKGKDRFRAEVEEECLTIVDLLERFPSARPPLALLLQLLPALSPRYYSIASSPLVLPSRVRIAFSVVSWTTPKGRKREGLCTNWLHRLCQEWTSSAEHAAWQARVSGAEAANAPGPEFSIFVAPSKGFKLPEDPERRIIMVGPGTGVAPFVGFIQHRNTLAEERRAEEAT